MLMGELLKVGTKSRFLCGNIKNRFDNNVILIVVSRSSENIFVSLKSQSKEPESLVSYSLSQNMPDLT